MMDLRALLAAGADTAAGSRILADRADAAERGGLR